MNKIDIVRAWKDEEYRASLTEAERAQLPASPAGVVEVNEADLAGVAGGGFTCNTLLCSDSCCTGPCP